MPSVSLYVEADVACWTSGIAAGQGPHLPVGYYGGAVYRSAMRFPIPAWAGWTSIDSATLTFYISNHQHVAPSGGTHYVSRQNVGSLWTKGAGGADCDADGFTGGNNTQNSDIPSTSTDRASFLCGVTANASKTVTVTGAVAYYRNNGASKIVFIFEASGSGEYTEIWASEKAGYDAVLTINYTDASAPNPPDLTAPANLSTVVSDHPDISFIPRDVQNNVHTSYHYQVGTDPTFASGIVEDQTVAGSFASNAVVTRTILAALTRGTTYYWRVQTTDATGTGGWSTNAQFTVKANPVVTIDTTRRMEYSSGPRLRVNWSVTGGTQKTYRVTAPGYDSGTLTEAEVSHLLATLALTNGTAVSITVTVTDTDNLTGSASRSFTPRWGLTTHKKTLAGLPVNWQTPTILPPTQPADTQLIVEYGSAAAAADAVPTAWFSTLASVPKTLYFHWRAWFIPSATVGPTLDSLLIQYDQTAAALDKWKSFGAADMQPPWYVDTGEYVYGSRSVAVTCNGTTLSLVSETVRLRAGRSYIISGLIKSEGNSGALYQLMTPGGSSFANAAGVTIRTNPVTETRNWYESDQRDVRRYRSEVYVVPVGADIDVQVWCRATGATGTKAWFDAVKLEESTVATPWGPSAVGAVVLDAGGLQIDASKGGLLRLRGSNGLAASVVELGAAGLYQGGSLLVPAPFVSNSPPASPFNGQLWWDDDDNTLSGASAYGSGIAFPSTPAVYDRFFRTTDRVEYFWDGTRWLSTALHTWIASGGQRGVFPFAATTNLNTPCPVPSGNYWVEQWWVDVYVVAPNDGSSYWNLVVANFGTLTTQSRAPVTQHHITAIPAVQLQAAPAWVQLDVTRVGSAGTVYPTAAFRYRTVGA